jgi:RsiW-degrading membrane proteinase PrsW (M82 family)
MSVWIILSGILAPALFWVGYFYYQDRFRPEPLTRMGTAYLLGIASALGCVYALRLAPLFGLPFDPSALLEGDRLSYLLYSVGITGMMEELFKFLPFGFIVLRFPSFDERTDGILYASFIALGFATYENILYLPHLEGFELFGRAFASPLTHTIFSSIWGYTVGLAYMRSVAHPGGGHRSDSGRDVSRALQFPDHLGRTACVGLAPDTGCLDLEDPHLGAVGEKR